MAGTNSAKVVQYRLSELQMATKHFSADNFLGEGGSGRVYKGETNGQTIAVKKLRAGSTITRGNDIRNEVSMLHSLEHDNLVKLLGFCSEAGDYLLVYEYISNGDLRRNLYDEENGGNLNWEMRFKIMNGLCRGLCYLHNLEKPVIHRDIKPANVLLDENYNVKIVDFGISKIFNNAKTQNTTKHGSGTPGYYAPELWSSRHYSPKSDVYNFGLLVLEMIVGCTTKQFSISNDGKTLSHVAWLQWKEKKPLVDLIDQSIWSEHLEGQITRCVQVGLLCVQNDCDKRPFMNKVLEMLNNPIDLPEPDTPGFLHDSSNHIKFGPTDSVEPEDTSNHSESQPSEDGNGIQLQAEPEDSTRLVEFKPSEHATVYVQIKNEDSSSRIEIQTNEHAKTSVEIEHEDPSGRIEFQFSEHAKVSVHIKNEDSSSCVEFMCRERAKSSVQIKKEGASSRIEFQSGENNAKSSVKIKNETSSGHVEFQSEEHAKTSVQIENEGSTFHIEFY